MCKNKNLATLFFCVVSVNSQAMENIADGKITFIGSIVESGCVFESNNDREQQPKVICKKGVNTKTLMISELRTNSNDMLRYSTENIYYHVRTRLVTIHHR